MKTNRQNRRRWSWGAALLALAAAGCGGKSVDLDARGDARASDDPGTVIEEQEVANLLAVDDQRLYWSKTEKVRSCLKTACTSSLVDYPAPPPIGGQIDGVYWLAPYAGELFWGTPHGVLACPAFGCAGSPRVVANADYAAYAVDEEGVFAIMSDGAYLAPREGGAWSLLAGLPAGQDPGSAVTHGPYLYWTREAEDAQVTLARMRKDGSSGPEVLAQFDSGGPSSGSALGVNDTHIYFADQRQAGAIFRCPLEGCSGPPENLFGPVRSPTRLAVDNDQLCVIYGKELSDTRVGCWATHDPPKISDVFKWAESVVMDASNVYVSRTLLDPDTLDFSQPFVGLISRIAR